MIYCRVPFQDSPEETEENNEIRMVNSDTKTKTLNSVA
jgi:hypothetical protein